jgi:putative membrane protein
MQTAESSNKAITTIVGISAVATAFLLWLLYVHHASPAFANRFNFLPALDAVLNGLCAICLVIGFSFIRKKNIAAHRASMISAFIFSSIFLVSYIVNHALHGDTRFPGQGIVRPIYFFILISHILLSVVVLPMVLTTFFFSLTGRFPQHKKIARFTFPIWLYVSVTGVVVYAMLAIWR